MASLNDLEGSALLNHLARPSSDGGPDGEVWSKIGTCELLSYNNKKLPNLFFFPLLDDGPMFYQCSPDPTPLKLTKLCLRLLLNLLSMTGQHQGLTNVLPIQIEKILMSWENIDPEWSDNWETWYSVGKLFLDCWENIDVGQRLGKGCESVGRRLILTQHSTNTTQVKEHRVSSDDCMSIV